jgi:hypothetical protein
MAAWLATAAMRSLAATTRCVVVVMVAVQGASESVVTVAMELFSLLTAAIAGARAATADCSGVTAATAVTVVTPRGLVRVVATAARVAEAAH